VRRKDFIKELKSSFKAGKYDELKIEKASSAKVVVGDTACSHTTDHRGDYGGDVIFASPGLDRPLAQEATYASEHNNQYHRYCIKTLPMYEYTGSGVLIYSSFRYKNDRGDHTRDTLHVAIIGPAQLGELTLKKVLGAL